MNQSPKIPFLDLVTMHRDLRDELTSVFETALGTAGFIGGPMVEKFEREFAQYCQTEYCVGVNSGTDALRFALMAAGIGNGDIVLTVPMTFIATTEAISQAGASPDFVDIDARTFTMDPAKLLEYLENQCYVDPATGLAINRKSRQTVKAVIPVHLYGQMAEMDSILDIARRFRMVVVEDACQAHGAEYYSKKEGRWRRAGSMGQAAAFSFYPGKNLGACGEGGAVTTNDENLTKKIRMIRDHGQSKKYYHDIEGYNGRLDSIQAGILSVKLAHLDEWNRQRRLCANRYSESLGALTNSLTIPEKQDRFRHVYHIYAIRTQNRDDLQKHLNDAGIGTGIHYPIPVHLQRAYTSYSWLRGDFPNTEQVSEQVLSLPMYPGLDEQRQKIVSDSVLQFASLQSPA